MRNDVRWLASLCAQEGLISDRLAAQLVAALPPDAGIEVLVKNLLGGGVALNPADVTRLAEEARDIADSGAEPPAMLDLKVGAGAELADFRAIEARPDEELRKFVLDLLQAAQKFGASDLHLSAGTAPFVRKQRLVEPVSATMLTRELSSRLNLCLLSADERARFEATDDLDYALAFEGGQRIRVNLMVHKDGVAGTYRLVPGYLRGLSELGFKQPEVIQRLTSYHNGLILLTGPVGSGKTSTLNTLVDLLNRNRSEHIVTVEDPIEFIHVNSRCNVTQRQVGPHTDSFAAALKSALREDPDIIVVGELRDLEAIEMAITASETGHLVIGTMHTSDSTATLNRLLDAFPPGQQGQIRAMVSESLRGIVCQRLLPSRDGRVILACEILVNTVAVSSMIRDAKTQGIPSAIETGRREGMISMDNSIYELWQEKKITDETALANIANRQIRQRIDPAQ